MSAADQPVYSIGAVAQMLDVPASTIRAWQERYGIVIPARSEGAQRLYSQAQVEQLRFVKRQIDGGKSAADAHRLLDQAMQGAPVQDPATDPEERRPLILIAERDAYAAELAEYFLRTEGFGVATATEGLQARLQFQERSPDLVILDLLISGGAGFRLCRQFASAASGRVLALSALDSADEALLAGASAFLKKPVEPLQLVSVVRELLRSTPVPTAPSAHPVRP